MSLDLAFIVDAETTKVPGYLIFSTCRGAFALEGALHSYVTNDDTFYVRYVACLV